MTPLAHLLPLAIAAAAFSVTAPPGLVDYTHVYRQCNLTAAVAFPKVYELYMCYHDPDAPAEFHQDIMYIHVFKAGGTTVSNVLDVLCHRTKQFAPYPHVDKARISHYTDPRTFAFTFIRDPVERFLSAYHEVMRVANERTHRARNTTKERIEATLDARLQHLDHFIRRIEHDGINHSKNHDMDGHIIAQTSFLRLPPPASHIPNLRYIGLLGDDTPQTIRAIVSHVQNRSVPDSKFTPQQPKDNGRTGGFRARAKGGLPMRVVHVDELPHSPKSPNPLPARAARIRRLYSADETCLAL